MKFYFFTPIAYQLHPQNHRSNKALVVFLYYKILVHDKQSNYQNLLMEVGWILCGTGLEIYLNIGEEYKNILKIKSHI